MAAFFKKLKKKEKQEEKKPVSEKIAEKEAKPKEEKTSRPKKKLVLAPLILKNPQITEKVTRLQESNCYVFKVYQRANKPEIKKAIEEKYNVKVVSLRTINAPRKQKRLGRSIGWQKGYKKAVIGLEKGQSIEIMPR